MSRREQKDSVIWIPVDQRTFRFLNSNCLIQMRFYGVLDVQVPLFVPKGNLVFKVKGMLKSVFSQLP